MKMKLFIQKIIINYFEKMIFCFQGNFIGWRSTDWTFVAPRNHSVREVFDLEQEVCYQARGDKFFTGLLGTFCIFKFCQQ